MPKKVRAAKVSIDIRERAVNIIQITSAGVIVKAGSSPLPASMPEAPDQYAASLSNAIIKAAKIAKIRNHGKCVIVVGGPQFITRSFVWPEMPPDALQLNAESEIIHYLPSESEDLIVGYRVLRRNVSTLNGSSHIELDVLVAAITKKLSSMLQSAVKLAGFTATRIDIRENARDKLVRTPRMWKKKRKKAADKRNWGKADQLLDQNYVFDPKGSFAILNVADSLVNMTVFVKGVFYASRYFSSGVMTALQSKSSSAADISGLITEIASTIDYIQYRERGLKVSSIVLFCDEQSSKDLLTTLSEHLEIPAIQGSDRLASVVKPSKRVNLHLPLLLDAYGAAITPPHSLSADLSLKLKKKKRGNVKRIVRNSFFGLLAASALLAAGLYIPHYQIQKLERQKLGLSRELTRYTIPGDVAGLQLEVSHMTKMLGEAEAFHAPPAASAVLRAIHGVLPPDTVLISVSITESSVRISGTTDTLDTLATFIRSLRGDEIFTGADANTAYYHADESTSEVTFEITLAFPQTEDEE